jgi:hypothetical protein
MKSRDVRLWEDTMPRLHAMILLVVTISIIAASLAQAGVAPP